MEPEAGAPDGPPLPSPIKGPPIGLPPRSDSLDAVSIAARPSHRRMGSGPESVRWGCKGLPGAGHLVGELSA